MKKIFLMMALVSCLAISACGAKEKTGESSVSVSDETAKDDKKKETTQEEKKEKKEGKKKYEHEEWEYIGFWKGTAGVNMDALWEVAGEFVRFDIYQASHMTKEYTGTGTFMWLDFYFAENATRKDGEPPFPENIEDVPEDWHANELPYYMNVLSSSNGMDLYLTEDLTFTVESCEKVTINGRDFMREVAFVEARDDSGLMDEIRSGKYIAYYYQEEDGTGVVIAGDKSDNQDMFHRVEETLDAIMQSYRPDITGLNR